MSEEERKLDVADPEAEITTEEPVSVPEPPKKWRMPEPVFRQTSGYLPQGFERRYPGAMKPPATPPPPPPAPDPFSQTFVGTPGMSPHSFAAPPEPEPAAPAAVSVAAPAAASEPAAAIEPQPDVDVPEEPILEAPAPAPPTTERSRGAKMFLAVLMILAALVFVVIFLGLIYYIFLRP